MPKPPSISEEKAVDSKIPGPPDPPITPGAEGWPSRDHLQALVATLGVFEWCEANGLLEEWSGELRRAHAAFMFAWGPVAERWREQTGEEPSWSQYAHLIHDNQRLREENDKLAASVRSLTGAPEEGQSHKLNIRRQRGGRT